MPSVEYPAIDEVLLIHQRVIEETGGSHGGRSMDLLESALNRPRAGFGDEEFFPELFGKVAALFEAIILNHPSVDGNKRTATIASEFLLEINGHTLSAKDIDLEDFAVHIAESRPSLEEIEWWLRSHSSSIER